MKFRDYFKFYDGEDLQTSGKPSGEGLLISDIYRLMKTIYRTTVAKKKKKIPDQTDLSLIQQVFPFLYKFFKSDVIEGQYWGRTQTRKAWFGLRAMNRAILEPNPN